MSVTTIEAWAEAIGEAIGRRLAVQLAARLAQPAAVAVPSPAAPRRRPQPRLAKAKEPLAPGRNRSRASIEDFPAGSVVTYRDRRRKEQARASVLTVDEMNNELTLLNLVTREVVQRRPSEVELVKVTSAGLTIRRRVKDAEPPPRRIIKDAEPTVAAVDAAPVEAAPVDAAPVEAAEAAATPVTEPAPPAEPALTAQAGADEAPNEPVITLVRNPAPEPARPPEEQSPAERAIAEAMALANRFNG